MNRRGGIADYMIPIAIMVITLLVILAILIIIGEGGQNVFFGLRDLR